MAKVLASFLLLVAIVLVAPRYCAASGTATDSDPQFTPCCCASQLADVAGLISSQTHSSTTSCDSHGCRSCGCACSAAPTVVILCGNAWRGSLDAIGEVPSLADAADLTGLKLPSVPPPRA